MNIWLTADTHFGHEAMVEYCGRPKDFEDIIFKHLSVVPENDLLIHLGDICIGKDARRHEDYIMPLKCKKWLIRGNHDKKSIQWYLEHGWDFVGRKVEIKLHGYKILFSHRPMPDIGYDLNIHGHLHNSNHRDEEDPWHDKQRLLAIEYTDLKPVTLKSFLKK